MPQVYVVSAVARPAYYDRQPLSIFANHFNSYGPHGTTVRASYGPPEGKAAYIEMVDVLMTRVTAGAGGGPAQSLLYFLVGGGPSYVIFNPQMYSAVVGAQQLAHADSFGFIEAGDSMQWQTVDQFTAGQVYYQLALKGTQYVQ